MSNTEKIIGTFHNVITGEIVTRELTSEEISALPQLAPPPEES